MVGGAHNCTELATASTERQPGAAGRPSAGKPTEPWTAAALPASRLLPPATCRHQATAYCRPRPNRTSSVICPLRWYRSPAWESLGHGRYALMGHHPKPGTAPMPPTMRPVPSQPQALSASGTPQVAHTSCGAASCWLAVAAAAGSGAAAWRQGTAQGAPMNNELCVWRIAGRWDKRAFPAAAPKHRGGNRVVHPYEQLRRGNSSSSAASAATATAAPHLLLLLGAHGHQALPGLLPAAATRLAAAAKGRWGPQLRPDGLLQHGCYQCYCWCSLCVSAKS